MRVTVVIMDEVKPFSRIEVDLAWKPLKMARGSLDLAHPELTVTRKWVETLESQPNHVRIMGQPWPTRGK